MGSYSQPDQLPYWQVNVAPEDREEECPEFLRGVSDKDVRIIGSSDDEFCVQTWPQVVDIIRTGRLADFQRWPSDLRRYRKYTWQLKRDHGSVMNFMLRKRLCWSEPVVPLGSKRFEYQEDFRIMMNDWPYGLDERIVHLVVWTKFDLPDDRETEAEVEAFVDKTFSPGVCHEKRIWFKNPPSLKSVHAVEHFHVLLFDPDLDFVQQITKGDGPRGQRGSPKCNRAREI
ncbi:hypothetical protein DHEL01_v211342 [Diaporthe helianthi]|uniref:N-acetylglucosamine-induced protein 1 n=1 Tax=Diaporthe helianthi TaxID=158607 RepID=A0A2P5HJ30_DIAHE|nr:hypothetical protein DHEL01_v211342 [Diaporthe helianthi]